MKLRNILFVLFVALTSVLAASYSNTLVMNLDGFDVQQYNCQNDQYCNNPTQVLDTNTNTNSYTFSCPNDNYYAEYLFKEGFLPKGFIVHKYNGINNFIFNKKSLCTAPINLVEISEDNVNQGTQVLVTVNVESALQGADAGTPNYRPLDHIDWFDADTIVRLRLVQNDITVLEQEELVNILIDTNEDVEFSIDTTSLTGEYQIVVETEVVDEMCLDSEIVTQEFTLNVNPVTSINPEINFLTSSISLCQYEDFTFNNYNIIDDGFIVDYEWDFNNDGVIDSTQEYPVHSFSNLGNNLVNLRVRDNMGLTDSDTITVNVNDCSNPSTIYVEIEADPEEGEAPLEVDFSAQVNGGTQPYSYAWDLDDDGSYDDSTDDDPSYEFEDEGDYTVRLRVTDIDGNFGTDSIIIHVEEESDEEDSEYTHGSHDLVIEEILAQDVVYNGDSLNIDLKLKNSGELAESATLVVQIEELGISIRLTGFNLQGDRSIWKQVTLEVPEETPEGFYTIKATLSNNYHSDIAYKELSLEDKESIWISVSNTEEKKTDWLWILEIAFLVLVISLLIVGIIIILRRLLIK